MEDDGFSMLGIKDNYYMMVSMKKSDGTSREGLMML